MRQMKQGIGDSFTHDEMAKMINKPMPSGAGIPTDMGTGGITNTTDTPREMTLADADAARQSVLNMAAMIPMLNQGGISTQGVLRLLS